MIKRKFFLQKEILVNKIMFCSVVGIILLSGCTTTRMGKRVDQNKLSHIKIGITTEKEIVDLLGKPSLVREELPDGSTRLTYWYMEAENDYLHYFPVICMFPKKKTKSKQECLLVIIDKTGKVARCNLQELSNNSP